MINFVPFIGILILVLIYVSFKYENHMIAILLSSGLIVLGVEMLTNGISLYDNILTYGLGVIYLFIGSYIWIAVMYDYFLEEGMI